jgi:putative transposase
MIRSFKYAIYPSRQQRAALESWLRLERELYNAALQERKEAYQKQGISISLYDQTYQIKGLRRDRAELAEIPFTSAFAVLDRLNKAFGAFFCRVKSGEKPGYPRFKGASRWDSIPFAQITKSPIVAGGKRIKVPNLGTVKAKIHRPLEGRPRTMTLKRDYAGRWFCSIACDQVPAAPLPATGREVGIDLGLLSLVASSDGTALENPRPLAAARIALERAQRRVSRRKRGGKRRKAAVRLLARHHAHVANIRRENHICTARSLVAQYDTIFVEKLNIRGMSRGMLAKSVNDAAWGGFLHWLHVKAESAGREVVEVDPRGTSQTCSKCGVEVHKELWQRTHRCPSCGLVMDRDVNAALNILERGQRLRGGALDVVRPLRSAEYTRSLSCI